jgi:hypothetical protein
MNKKHTHEPHSNLYNEIEVFTAGGEYRLLAGTVLIVIITIALILWEPDVEAIGTWIYNLIY